MEKEKNPDKCGKKRVLNILAVFRNIVILLFCIICTIMLCREEPVLQNGLSLLIAFLGVFICTDRIFRKQEDKHIMYGILSYAVIGVIVYIFINYERENNSELWNTVISAYIGAGGAYFGKLMELFQERKSKAVFSATIKENNIICIENIGTVPAINVKILDKYFTLLQKSGGSVDIIFCKKEPFVTLANKSGGLIGKIYIPQEIEIFYENIYGVSQVQVLRQDKKSMCYYSESI